MSLNDNIMIKRTDSFYNKFSFLYPLIDVFLKPQKKILFNIINRLPEGDLLEIGVGNGAHFTFYKKHRITGIDTSESMLKRASRQNCRDIKILKMGGEALLFDEEKFDYVVLSHVIAVVDDPKQVLNEVARVLKPQGQLFILNHFTPDTWLKYIDRSLETASKIFHFRSCFHIRDMGVPQRFVLLNQVHFGLASYFKLLIYKKSE